LNITNYIFLQDSIGFGLSNEFLEKKVVEVSYISQVPTKAELYGIMGHRAKDLVFSCNLEMNKESKILS